MEEPKKIRVMVVDDSILYRKIISDILHTIESVEVVGVAPNGKLALMKMPSLKPDLLTLDIEMPEMDGLEVLKALQESKSTVGAVMVSSHTVQGGKMTMQALELGAFDFISKPTGGTAESNTEAITESLRNIISAFAKRKLDYVSPVSYAPQPIISRPAAPAAPPPPQPRPVTWAMPRFASKAVAIGVSTGGPLALTSVIPKLPAKLGVPVFLVQHMPALFTKSLAENLAGKSSIEVVEAAHGQIVKPDCVYIAPGGKQMKVVRSGQMMAIEITDDPPENSCRPSVDYLFRSVLEVYGNKVTSVIMTGMGADGVKEMLRMKNAGAMTLAQDRESCVVYGMPKEAVESGAAQTVVRLSDIADEIVKSVR